MSHVAFYKVDLKKIKPSLLNNVSFQKAFKEVLSKIFSTTEVFFIASRFRILVGNGDIIYVGVNLKGELQIAIDYQTTSSRKKNQEEYLKKIKQGLILTSQIYRYKKYKVEYKNKKLMAEVLA